MAQSAEQQNTTHITYIEMENVIHNSQKPTHNVHINKGSSITHTHTYTYTHTRTLTHLLTFIQPVGVSFLGGTVTEKGQDVGSNVLHCLRVELATLHFWNVLSFDQLILLLTVVIK